MKKLVLLLAVIASVALVSCHKTAEGSAAAAEETSVAPAEEEASIAPVAEAAQEEASVAADSVPADKAK